jgi:hypothetical protein
VDSRAACTALLCVLCAPALSLCQQPQEVRLSNELTYLYAEPPASAAAPHPLLVLLTTSDFWKQWQLPVAERGWSLVVAPLLGPNDASARAIQAILQDFRKRSKADAMRTYLAGDPEATAVVFYLASRVPDLWAAALAIQGNPKPAIDSGRLFAANTQLVPVLWVSSLENQALKTAGYHLERPSQANFTSKDALDWLAGQQRDPFPSKIDCETGTPEFARCYWAEMTQLDPARRNDVLPSSRVPPGSGASLALGGFGFDPTLPGPGLVVGWLPPNYQGPLKLEDRLVAIAGKQIRDARQYLEFMDQATEEKAVAVMIQRGKQHLRIETRIVLPKPEEKVSARLQAEFLSDTRELLIISRGVAQLRLTLPPYWVPCPISWNGLAAGKADQPGCWTITEGGQARRCP